MQTDEPKILPHLLNPNDIYVLGAVDGARAKMTYLGSCDHVGVEARWKWVLET